MITVGSISNKKNLPKSYLKSLDELPEPRRTQMYRGEWVSLSDVIFFAYDYQKHIGSYYDKLIEFLKNSVKEGFIAKDYVDMLIVSDDINEILEKISTYKAPKDKW